MAIQELEACWEPWALAAGLHLLKLSLKWFAMIAQGGSSGRQRAEELALVLPVSLHLPLQILPMVPTHTQIKTLANRIFGKIET